MFVSFLSSKSPHYQHYPPSSNHFNGENLWPFPTNHPQRKEHRLHNVIINFVYKNWCVCLRCCTFFVYIFHLLKRPQLNRNFIVAITLKTRRRQQDFIADKQCCQRHLYFALTLYFMVNFYCRRCDIMPL